MKYKNIIFDFGNTIIAFEPEKIVDCFFDGNEEEKLFLINTVFDRKYWDRLDDGSMSQKQYHTELVKKLPEKYHDFVYNVCNNWYDCIPYVSGMDTLIKKLKKDGYNIYLLSNILAEFKEHLKDFEVFEFFDGIILSGVEKTVKPNDEIFQLILRRYKLNPKECLFIDDMEKNILAGEKNGIHGYLFDNDAKKLEKYIYKE